MKTAQTTLLVFVSKVVSSATGFVATIYFARLLGAEILGIYASIIALISWIVYIGRAGILNGMKKRLSEGNEQGSFLTAGTVMMFILVSVLSILLWISRTAVESYFTSFQQYSELPLLVFLILLFVSYMLFTLVTQILEGQDIVHIAGLLRPVNLGLRSLLQIGFVFFGFGLVGMLSGYIGGLLIAALIGLVFISIVPALPEKQHFVSLFDYAKFSWLGGLQSRAFNNLDILILGVFVSQMLVGIYSVAWSLTMFMNLFSSSIGQAMFPKISNASAQGSVGTVVRFVEDSIAYSGYITIPGFIGGLLLADRLLIIYGESFVQGSRILRVLLLSILIYGYMQSIMSALNAIDRPESAFYVNAVFIFTNAVANILLIQAIGWLGAAVASLLASVVGLLCSYYILTRSISVSIPVTEISRQIVAAIVMGGVVWSGREIIETINLLQHNILVVILLVTYGALVYNGVLAVLSKEFRNIIQRNIQFEKPNS